MEQLAKAALLRPLGSAAAGPEESIEVAVQPDRALLRQERADRRDRDSGPRLAAAAVRARPDREADARSVLRHHRSRHGRGATSVTTLTDRIYQLVKIEPKRHAPPICTFFWNDQFPGSSLEGNAGSAASRAIGDALGPAAGAVASAIGGAIGAVASAVAGIAAAASGNQRRNGFQCIVESVKQKFTFFSPEGVPLRATLTVTLREYKTLDEQLAQSQSESPDRTHSHVIAARRDARPRIAAHYYRRPGDWRSIADANDIEDPRRLDAGRLSDGSAHRE